ncbi:MAG: bifunctional folylpolyglutamate synthase/dihydrofolate synthase [Cytophaga sp.]|uniref:bifunctional folylpolyglutamate synthase/dihydrofolate synthase n=1 Tax=Cytophaga sp. TaxID=29535 RepID=UPI003F7EE545
MHYSQAIDFLYNQYPAFEKQGGLAYKPGLDNVLGISAAFGNPHLLFKSVHIAGTNGKGSSSSMLASVLQSAGYKVGLYTSPHIHDFTERIRINGIPVPQDVVVDFVQQHTAIFDQFKPSFFEITTILAFNWFAKQQVDIAIIETGMGGRLDATNIIQPEVSLITNVSLDHTQFLGNTPELIAAEKAGIIKKSTPIVISEWQEGLISIYEEIAHRLEAPLIKAFEHYKAAIVSASDTASHLEVTDCKVNQQYNLALDLQGNYQAKNIIGVLSVLDQLVLKGWNISKTSVKSGLEHVQQLSGFRGRWQVVSHKPLVVLDAAHNVAGMEYSVKQLQQYKKPIHIVIGMVKDKDISQVLSLMPKEAAYYFCQADSHRAMPAAELEALAQNFGLRGQAIPNVNKAFKQAQKNAGMDDVIWVGGSLYVLGDLVIK